MAKGKFSRRHNLLVIFLEDVLKLKMKKQASGVCDEKNNVLISQPKHMLWVLKRTVSTRRFFWAPKTNIKNDG